MQRAVGEPIRGCPHVFRDLANLHPAHGSAGLVSVSLRTMLVMPAATTWAIAAPDQIGVARDLLGHSDLRTTTRHYNRARGIEASRAHALVIKGMRRKHTGPADPARCTTCAQSGARLRIGRGQGKTSPTQSGGNSGDGRRLELDWVTISGSASRPLASQGGHEVEVNLKPC